MNLYFNKKIEFYILNKFYMFNNYEDKNVI